MIITDMNSFICQKYNIQFSFCRGKLKVCEKEREKLDLLSSQRTSVTSETASQPLEAWASIQTSIHRHQPYLCMNFHIECILLSFSSIFRFFFHFFSLHTWTLFYFIFSQWWWLWWWWIISHMLSFSFSFRFIILSPTVIYFTILHDFLLLFFH